MDIGFQQWISVLVTSQSTACQEPFINAHRTLSIASRA
jgi:hypothetical protein